jgi:hypothetical protein
MTGHRTAVSHSINPNRASYWISQRQLIYEELITRGLGWRPTQMNTGAAAT